MAVRVRLFAALREAAGTSETAAAAGSLQAVLDELARTHGPEFARVTRIATAVLEGERLADPLHPIPDGAELALLPPVSGGGQDVRQSPGPSAASPGSSPPRPRPRPTAARAAQRDRPSEGWRPGDESAVPATGLLLGLALVGALLLGPGATAGVILAGAVLALLDGAGVLTARGSRPLVPAAAVPALLGPLLVVSRGAGWGTFALCLLGGALVAVALLAVTRRADAPEVLAGTAVLGFGVGLASTGLMRLALGPLGATGVVVLLVLTCLAGSARTVAGWLRLPGPLALIAAAITVVLAALGLAAIRVSATTAPLLAAALAAVAANQLVTLARRGRYPRRAVGQGAVLAAAGTMGLAAPVLAVCARYLA